LIRVFSFRKTNAFLYIDKPVGAFSSHSVGAMVQIVDDLQSVIEMKWTLGV